jgi:hypothetical protein
VFRLRRRLLALHKAFRTFVQLLQRAMPGDYEPGGLVSLFDAELIWTANRVGGPRHCIFHGQRITEWQPIAFIDEDLERDQHSGFRRDHLAGKFSGGVKQFAVWNTAARKPPWAASLPERARPLSDKSFAR